MIRTAITAFGQIGLNALDQKKGNDCRPNKYEYDTHAYYSVELMRVESYVTFSRQSGGFRRRLPGWQTAFKA